MNSDQIEALRTLIEFANDHVYNVYDDNNSEEAKDNIDHISMCAELLTQYLDN